jgi:hypothetical protein
MKFDATVSGKGDDGKGVTVQFTGGTQDRKMEIDIMCDKDGTGPVSSFFLYSSNPSLF